MRKEQGLEKENAMLKKVINDIEKAYRGTGEDLEVTLDK